MQELERRLRGRGQDDEGVIQRRLANAQAEMAHASEFKYAIINKDFNTARQELARIVRGERRAH
jgi:guanylate kinase